VPRPDEAFLQAFHARHPGATTAAYARGRTAAGGSSYDALAAAIPVTATAVLDLGCGDGFLLERLARRDRILVGVDLSADELAVARARPALAAAALLHGRAAALPLATASLDACASHLAFTLMAEPDVVADELARVLRPGATFAAIVGGGPAADQPGNAFDAFLDHARPFLAASPAPRLGDPRTRHAAGLDAILGAAGFATPVSVDRIVVDLAGTADEVWATLATLYELSPLPAAALATLEPAARAVLAALATDGRVPCAMAVGLVRAIRR
jgi:SAM-dependent methyltransferase